MRPLKIALLSRWYAEEHRRTGGTGTVQELAEAVAVLGHEVIVLSQSRSVRKLAPAQPGEFGALETWLTPRERRRDFTTGLRDRWAKRQFGHRKVFSDALDLRDFLARRGPFDVLWAQCEEPDGLVAATAAQMGVKVPPTLTQIYALRYRFLQPADPRPVQTHATFHTEFFIPTGQKALGAAFVQAARVIASSTLVAEGPLVSYVAREMSPAQLIGKTRIISHNLQAAFLQAALRPGPEPEPGRILFLGALNEKKGALVFLEAIAGIDPSLGLNFAIAGETTEENPDFDRRWATQLAATRAQGHAPELLGRLSSAEVITQVRRASLVVLPSLFDEFSRALAEVLVLGRPVVTTETVGAAAFVRTAEAGIVVRAGEAGALRGAIIEVLRHHATYLENARSFAPRLAHELAPGAIARQIAQQLSEIAPYG